MSGKFTSTGLSKTWAVSKRHQMVYTGGKTQFACNPDTLAAQCGDSVNLLDLRTGEVLSQVQQALDESKRESINSFCLHSNRFECVTSSSNGLLRVWNLSSGECVRNWKGHRRPVNDMTYDPSGTLVATGSSDKTVMVWDVSKGYCTHNFRGHTNIITHVCFHPDASKLQLVSLSSDRTVRVWDLYKKAAVAVLSDHFSAPTSVVFTADGKLMCTAGRDMVIHIYDTADYKLLLTLPVYEEIESLQLLANTAGGAVEGAKQAPAALCARFISGGSHGRLRLWQLSYTDAVSQNTTKLECVCEKLLQDDQAVVPRQLSKEELPQAADESGAYHIDSIRSQDGNSFVVVTQDHIFRVFDADSMCQRSCVVGFNDEIVDIRYIPPLEAVPQGSQGPPSRIAMATNSPQLRITEVGSMNTHLLSGHSDIVLACAASPDGRFIGTVSKDCTVRVWDAITYRCIAVGEGHTESVSAIAFPVKRTAYVAAQTPWLLTASRDRTMKMWDTRPLQQQSSGTDETHTLRTFHAVFAHTKDVNAIAVAPNDRVIATGGQDKAVKLWSVVAAKNGSFSFNEIRELRGHKRGVWCVEFSPVDQIVASSSADKTIRLWTLSDGACVKTLQGHQSGVLCLRFLRAGMQIISSSADGLLKLWNVASSECVNTFEGHEDRAWTIAVRPPSHGVSAEYAAEYAALGGELDPQQLLAEWEMITGGSDSALCVWRDATKEEQAEEIAEAEKRLSKQQELSNCMAARNYEKTIQLMIELDQPHRLMGVLQEMLEIGLTVGGGKTWHHDVAVEMAELEQEASGAPDLVGTTTQPEIEDEAFAAAAGAVEGVGSTVGEEKLKSVLMRLTDEELNQLFEYIRTWNTHGRNSLIAQHVLYLVLRFLPRTRLYALSQFPPLINSLKAYTRRHKQRIDRLLQDSYLIDYVSAGMSLLQPKQELSKARVQSDDAPAAKRLKSEADSNDDASSASQGQTRLAEYFDFLSIEERTALEAEIIRKCLSRNEMQCSFMEYRGYKVVYRRYASLYFIVGCEQDYENELGVLEFIHALVETLDKYFENVCELDIMFNLEKAHFILNEMIMNGCIVETNKVNVLKPIVLLDKNC